MNLNKLLIATTLFSFTVMAQDTKGVYSNETEGSAVITTGNTRTQTYSLKTKSSYKKDKSEVTVKGGYLLGQDKPRGASEYVPTAENWNASVRYDYYLQDNLSIFAAHGWESDEFAGYYTRSNSDIGAKYTFWNIDKVNYAFAELGYRYTWENPTLGGDFDSHFVRAYGEVSKAFSETLTGKFWVEVLPDVSDTDNVQVNFEPSIAATLNTVFSVKLAYLGRYDTVPSGTATEKYDSTGTVSLIAKY